MKVKWHGYIFKGIDKETNLPIFEKDDSHVFEGEVVVTLPIPEHKKDLFNCSSQFIVALSDNTFTEVPISLCERVNE